MMPHVKIHAKPKGIPRANVAVASGEENGSKNVAVFVKALDSHDICEVVASIRFSMVEAREHAELIFSKIGTHLFGPLENFELYNDEGEEEDCAHATVRILGVAHHVTFVRVHWVDGVQVGTNDPYGRLDDILAGAEGAARTISLKKLFNLDGEWVVGLDPYRD